MLAVQHRRIERCTRPRHRLCHTYIRSARTQERATVLEPAVSCVTGVLSGVPETIKSCSKQEGWFSPAVRGVRRIQKPRLTERTPRALKLSYPQPLLAQLASLPVALRTQKCKYQYSARDFRSALARQPCQPSSLFWWDRLMPRTSGLAVPRPSQSLAQGCRAGTAEMGEKSSKIKRIKRVDEWLLRKVIVDQVGSASSLECHLALTTQCHT